MFSILIMVISYQIEHRTTVHEIRNIRLDFTTIWMC